VVVILSDKSLTHNSEERSDFQSQIFARKRIELRAVLQRKTLTSQVSDYVMDLIRTGAVKPGQQVPTETELTKTLGVSRTCVREAMKTLQSMGLVSIRQRVGATVLEPSSSNLLNAENFMLAIQMQKMDDLLEFRRIMEVGLASLAAEKAELKDVEAMRKALDDYRAEMGAEPVDCNIDMSFHAALAAASRNPIAVMVWQMLSEHLAQVLVQTSTLPHICDQTLSDHEEIYAAVRDRDAARARESMRSHLDNAERNWKLAMEELQRNSAKAAKKLKRTSPRTQLLK
jgi:GntR family transcriptional repressor for pyruvate dehydrogenase complex